MAGKRAKPKKTKTKALAKKPNARANSGITRDVSSELERLWGIRAVARAALSKPGDPSRMLTLLQNIDALMYECMTATRTWGKDGETFTEPAPQLGTALKAQELAAKILQLLGPEAVLQVNLPSPAELAEAKRVLQARGWRQMPVETEGEPHGE